MLTEESLPKYFKVQFCPEKLLTYTLLKVPASFAVSELVLSLKWLTVTLKIETAYRHGTNCFLEV